MFRHMKNFFDYSYLSTGRITLNNEENNNNSNSTTHMTVFQQ